MTPISLPFFNFVCYAVEMMTSYIKSGLDVSFNVFLIDEHVEMAIVRSESIRMLWNCTEGSLVLWKAGRSTLILMRASY